MFFTSNPEVPINQRVKTLLHGYLPVIEYNFTRDGIHYAFETFAVTLDGTPEGPQIAFVRVRVTNPSDESRVAWLSSGIRYQEPSTARTAFPTIATQDPQPRSGPGATASPVSSSAISEAIPPRTRPSSVTDRSSATHLYCRTRCATRSVMIPPRQIPSSRANCASGPRRPWASCDTGSICIRVRRSRWNGNSLSSPSLRVPAKTPRFALPTMTIPSRRLSPCGTRFVVEARPERVVDLCTARAQGHCQSGARLYRVRLPDAPKLVAAASCGGQSRVLDKGENPRFVVASLSAGQWAHAQVDSIRLKLFRIGATVRISAPHRPPDELITSLDTHLRSGVTRPALLKTAGNFDNRAPTVAELLGGRSHARNRSSADHPTPAPAW